MDYEKVLTESKKQVTVKGLLNNVNYKQRFEEILGKKSAGFMSSIVNISNSYSLQGCEPSSIISNAVIAASLDLPIDPNLGFAWIVPYNDKRKGKISQFQMGWKGYVQLALRTGQYKFLNVIEVYKSQFKSWNALTESLEADFTQEPDDEVVGYVAYFKLMNGFEKTSYWTKDKVIKHAKKFSKTYGNGPWQTEFDAMAKKTVLKNTLSKWGILSIDMQNGILADQGTFKKEIIENGDIAANVEYIDNVPFQDTTDKEENYEGTPFEGQ